MKLTKDQRYTMYCILLQEAESNELFSDNYSQGICYLMRYIFNFYPVSNYYFTYKSFDEEWFKDVAPELLKYEKLITAYWFKNWKERRKALKQCISETENF